ncbi:unnamed protein product [Arabidopsis arenosa]|uniref:Uncharacterized protein n=1 Tax=Arabidopsis arenosa TaxID=38785 RepID=A0A8S2AS59_ARAAE|nr:unnamed protein product [Arabidopsis arenosa]
MRTSGRKARLWEERNKYLPGFEGPLPFELETGYVSIGESGDVELFYYFVKSERNPENDPLMIWLTGGPGCSSICGLLFANGPLAFKGDEYNGTVPPLELTSFSWTKVANILYVESPAGSGFSYARTRRASETSDTKQMHQIDQFLRSWFVDHPEFISNPFYVGGDSYSGKIIPGVVQQISLGNEKGLTPLINLQVLKESLHSRNDMNTDNSVEKRKRFVLTHSYIIEQGYVLGNPLTDINLESNHRISFAHGMGLISDELFECMSEIYSEHILLRNCEVDYVLVDTPNIRTDGRRELKEFSGNDSSSLPPPSCFTYKYFLSAFWANDEKVRRALVVIMILWYRSLQLKHGSELSTIPLLMTGDLG